MYRSIMNFTPDLCRLHVKTLEIFFSAVLS